MIVDGDIISLNNTEWGKDDNENLYTFINILKTMKTQIINTDWFLNIKYHTIRFTYWWWQRCGLYTGKNGKKFKKILKEFNNNPYNSKPEPCDEKYREPIFSLFSTWESIGSKNAENIMYVVAESNGYLVQLAFFYKSIFPVINIVRLDDKENSLFSVSSYEEFEEKVINESHKAIGRRHNFQFLLQPRLLSYSSEIIRKGRIDIKLTDKELGVINDFLGGGVNSSTYISDNICDYERLVNFLSITTTPYGLRFINNEIKLVEV